MSISKSYNKHGPYSPSNEFCLTSSLNSIFYYSVSCLFCCLMQYTIAKTPRLVQWIQFRKPLLHRPSLMKILFSMLKWIPLANPGWLEKLLIISWNCWVKIMNEMETLNTFYVLPLLILWDCCNHKLCTALKHCILWPIWIATFCWGVTTCCVTLQTPFSQKYELKRAGELCIAICCWKPTSIWKHLWAVWFLLKCTFYFALLRNQTRLI